MLISGFQKLTLLDYPEKTACTVFTYGCNFRCPFCHNAILVTEGIENAIDPEEIFSFLKKRTGLLDGVCITGGEPTLQKDLIDFIRKIRELGFCVKLDTNGYNPEVLQELLSQGLCDYVAMDIKNSLEKYSLTAGIDVDRDKILRSISLIKEKAPDYEFRTTVVRELHTREDIMEICRLAGKDSKLFFQQFIDSGSLICQNLSPWPEQEIKTVTDFAASEGYRVSLRGM